MEFVTVCPQYNSKKQLQLIHVVAVRLKSMILHAISPLKDLNLAGKVLGKSFDEKLTKIMTDGDAWVAYIEHLSRYAALNPRTREQRLFQPEFYLIGAPLYFFGDLTDDQVNRLLPIFEENQHSDRYAAALEMVNREDEWAARRVQASADAQKFCQQSKSFSPWKMLDKRDELLLPMYAEQRELIERAVIGYVSKHQENGVQWMVDFLMGLEAID